LATVERLPSFERRLETVTKECAIAIEPTLPLYEVQKQQSTQKDESKVQAILDDFLGDSGETRGQLGALSSKLGEETSSDALAVQGAHVGQRQLAGRRRTVNGETGQNVYLGEAWGGRIDPEFE
jgi:hypothetical protein